MPRPRTTRDPLKKPMGEWDPKRNRNKSGEWRKKRTTTGKRKK